VQFSELQKLSDFDLDLELGQSHRWRSTHTPNQIKSEKLFVNGRTYVWMDLKI